MTQSNLRTRRTVRDEQQQKKQLIASLEKNDTTLVAFTSEEFLDYAVAVKVSQGMSRADAIVWLEQAGDLSEGMTAAAKRAWEHSKETVKTGGGFLPVALDTSTLRKLAVDLHRGGSVFSKYRVNTYLGRSYVIIEGYPRLRMHLTAARYLANNPKVIDLGVGKLGVKDAIRSGFVVSIIFSVSFHAIDQLMNDSATWHTFVAGVTVDVVSAVTGGAIVWGAAGLYTSGAVAMAAVGPLIIVIAAGIGMTLALNAIADRYELSSKLAQALMDAEERFRTNIGDIKSEFRKGLNYAEEDPVGFMHRLFGIPYLRGFEF